MAKPLPHGPADNRTEQLTTADAALVAPGRGDKEELFAARAALRQAVEALEHIGIARPYPKMPSNDAVLSAFLGLRGEFNSFVTEVLRVAECRTIRAEDPAKAREQFKKVSEALDQSRVSAADFYGKLFDGESRSFTARSMLLASVRDTTSELRDRVRLLTTLFAEISSIPASPPLHDAEPVRSANRKQVEERSAEGKKLVEAVSRRLGALRSSGTIGAQHWSEELAYQESLTVLNRKVPKTLPHHLAVRSMRIPLDGTGATVRVEDWLSAQSDVGEIWQRVSVRPFSELQRSGARPIKVAMPVRGSVREELPIPLGYTIGSYHFRDHAGQKVSGGGIERSIAGRFAVTAPPEAAQVRIALIIEDLNEHPLGHAISKLNPVLPFFDTLPSRFSADMGKELRSRCISIVRQFVAERPLYTRDREIGSLVQSAGPNRLAFLAGLHAGTCETLPLELGARLCNAGIFACIVDGDFLKRGGRNYQASPGHAQLLAFTPEPMILDPTTWTANETLDGGSLDTELVGRAARLAELHFDEAYELGNEVRARCRTKKVRSGVRSGHSLVDSIKVSGVGDGAVSAAEATDLLIARSARLSSKALGVAFERELLQGCAVELGEVVSRYLRPELDKESHRNFRSFAAALCEGDFGEDARTAALPAIVSLACEASRERVGTHVIYDLGGDVIDESRDDLEEVSGLKAHPRLFASYRERGFSGGEVVDALEKLAEVFDFEFVEGRRYSVRNAGDREFIRCYLDILEQSLIQTAKLNEEGYILPNCDLLLIDIHAGCELIDRADREKMLPEVQSELREIAAHCRRIVFDYFISDESENGLSSTLAHYNVLNFGKDCKRGYEKIDALFRARQFIDGQGDWFDPQSKRCREGGIEEMIVQVLEDVPSNLTFVNLSALFEGPETHSDSVNLAPYQDRILEVLLQVEFLWQEAGINPPIPDRHPISSLAFDIFDSYVFGRNVQTNQIYDNMRFLSRHGFDISTTFDQQGNENQEAWLSSSLTRKLATAKVKISDRMYLDAMSDHEAPLEVIGLFSSLILADDHATWRLKRDIRTELPRLCESTPELQVPSNIATALVSWRTQFPQDVRTVLDAQAPTVEIFGHNALLHATARRIPDSHRVCAVADLAIAQVYLLANQSEDNRGSAARELFNILTSDRLTDIVPKFRQIFPEMSLTEEFGGDVHAAIALAYAFHIAEGRIRDSIASIVMRGAGPEAIYVPASKERDRVEQEVWCRLLNYETQRPYYAGERLESVGQALQDYESHYRSQDENRVTRLLDYSAGGPRISAGSTDSFVHHTEYTPGDDIRLIDHRASASRDKILVKRFGYRSEPPAASRYMLHVDLGEIRAATVDPEFALRTLFSFVARAVTEHKRVSIRVYLYGEHVHDISERAIGEDFGARESKGWRSKWRGAETMSTLRTAAYHAELLMKKTQAQLLPPCAPFKRFESAVRGPSRGEKGGSHHVFVCSERAFIETIESSLNHSERLRVARLNIPRKS